MSSLAARVRPPSSVLPAAATLVAILTVACGLLIKAATGALGTPLPPFLFAWSPAADPLAIVTAAILASAVWAVPRIARLARPIAFAAASYALALTAGLALNLAHVGVRGWWSVFAGGPRGSRESAYEYLSGLPALHRGVGYYIGHFAQLMPELPLHAKGNPPGPLIALHWLGVSGPGGLAALCIGLGALTAPLAYDLGRTLGGEQRGRVAALLTSFTPSLLLFGVTSVDYAFAAMGLAAACLLVRPAAAALVAGATAAAIAACFSWLLLAIPAWAALVRLRRDNPRAAAKTAVACGLTVAALNAALALAYGYDPFAALHATAIVYGHVSTARPYAYWVLGSPVAWALMLGPPVAWLAVRAARTADPAAVALAIVIALSALLGFTKAETERIWLPFAPLACVAAASAIQTARLRLVAATLAAQALAVELLFATIW